MRNKALIAGFMALTLAPGAVLAQPYDPGCVRSNQDNHAAGTILGAIGGAILGSAIAGSNDHPCPTGYYYAPPPPPPEEAGFWRDAPHGLHERIDFIQSRIDRSAQSGWLAPREIDRLNHELSDVRYQDRSLHDRDGSPLPPADLQYLQSRLDHIAGELHWMEHNGG